MSTSQASSPLDSLDTEGGRLLEEALGAWQRRRACQYCMVAAAFFVLAGIQLAIDLARQDEVSLANWVDIVVAVVLCGGYAAAGLLFRRMPPNPSLVARTFGWMLVVAGATGIIGSFVVLTYDSQFWIQPDGLPTPAATRTYAAAGTALFLVFIVHFIGSLFVALPPWAALWPLLPLWTLYAGGVLLLEGPLWFRGMLAALFPLVGGPGVLWSIWRHGRWVSRFTIKFLGGRYGELRRDLSDARRVHEAIFPPRIDQGPLRLEYAYEPMRDVGGDFLFTRALANDALLVVLVDVTGHGVASALAVTRIHAALGILAGGDTVEPGELLARINAFVFEQLAPQGIYATAAAALIDPARRRLRWSSAGHPPAMLRRGTREGRVEIIDLNATSTMLGVLAASEFDSQAIEVEVAPGDVLVLCTDGLIEALGPKNEPFGTEGLRSVVMQRSDRVSEAAMEVLRAFSPGPVADDTLVVEVHVTRTA